jgi:hypothetical protein
MAKQIFHIFGHLNPSGEPTVYDTEYEQTKLFLCDTVADLPSSGFTDMDFAFTKTTGTFFVGNNGEWVGSHPVHSVFFTDTEGLNPNRLLGYGTWEAVGTIDGAWGWKRTA